MKRNLYALPARTPVEAPALRRDTRRPEREKLIYLPDYLERSARRRKPLVTWERDPSLPRWLDTLSIWVELLSTLGMAVWGGYWIWYAMWVLR